MGIPMDDIHTATVPAGPTSAQAETRDFSKLSLTELIREKERLEAELQALIGILESHGVNMTTSLLTFDGYPRDDLDIAQIRTTRARIIPLRNDYKTVMDKIEQRLHAHFAHLQETGGTAAPLETVPQSSLPADVMRAEPTPTQSSSSGLEDTPFAKVNSVAAGSPAAEAGLKAEDKIRSFGSINWMNHENLTKIAQTVQQNEGRALQVKVARPDGTGEGTTDLSLQLTPRRNWGGRGLLGCHLIPF